MFGWLLAIASVVVADFRAGCRLKLLEELMSVLSEQIAALGTAVQGVKDRVTAEIEELEAKIVDPDKVVTAVDLDGLKGCIDTLNTIAVDSETPTDGGTGGEPTPTPTPVSDVGVSTGTTSGTGTEVTTPPEGSNQ